MSWGLKPLSATPPDVAAIHMFRRIRAKRETPSVLLWAGAALLVLTGLNLVLGYLDLRTCILHSLVVATVWASAYAISRPRFPPRLVAVLAGLCSIVTTAEFQYEFWVNPTPIGFSYVVLIMLAAGPLILSPVVLAQVALLSVIGAIVIIGHAPNAVLAPSLPGDWVTGAVTAEIIGFILLFMRLRSIDELGKVTRFAELTATIDPLTGLYNRRGLEDLMGGIVDAAKTSNLEVQACFVDIDWLKTANDAHGHAFGDQVIRVVAEAVRSCAPASAVIARWGGDEFLVFGTGLPVDDDAMSQRLLALIAKSNLDLSKWPGSVSVGSASAPAREVSLDDLIYQADERMYARRRAKRSGN